MRTRAVLRPVRIECLQPVGDVDAGSRITNRAHRGSSVRQIPSPERRLDHYAGLSSGFAEVEATRSEDQKGRSVSGSWFSRWTRLSRRRKPVRKSPSRLDWPLGNARRTTGRYGRANEPTTRHQTRSVGAPNRAPRPGEAQAAELIATVSRHRHLLAFSPSSDILRKPITHPAFLL